MNNILNEVYFGKQKELLEIERILGELRDKCKLHTKFIKFTIDRNKIRKLNASDEIKEINRLFEKLFGFNRFDFVIDAPAIIWKSAYTYIYLKENNNKNYYKGSYENDLKLLMSAISVTSKGIKINKNKYRMNIIVYMPIEWMVDEELTTGELISAILHEIGHSISRIIVNFNTRDLFNIEARKSEDFADRIPPMYGYSVEYVNIMKKLHSGMKADTLGILNKIPIVNIFWSLFFIYAMALIDSGYITVIFSIYLTSSAYSIPFFYSIIMYWVVWNTFTVSTHGNMRYRIGSQIDQLYEDLKDINLSSETKKDLENKIKETEKVIDKMYKKEDYETIADYMFKLYFNYIQPWMPLEIINNMAAKLGIHTKEDMNKKINELYEEYLKKNKKKGNSND